MSMGTITGTNERGTRSKKGQSLAVLILFLAVFLVGPLSFIAYEVSLCNLAKQELNACVLSAALGATCTPAIDLKADVKTRRRNAESGALWIFQQNSVLGNSLTNAWISTPSSEPVGADQSVLSFKFVNPTATEEKRYVDISDKNGTMIEVTANYGFTPQFSKFFGVGGTWQISASAQLPLLPSQHQ
jgi:hypothetical protein